MVSSNLVYCLVQLSIFLWQQLIFFFQVTVLLKECRDIQLRCGSVGFDTVDDAANIDSRTHTETEAEKVISEHLVSSMTLLYFGIFFNKTIPV